MQANQAKVDAFLADPAAKQVTLYGPIDSGAGRVFNPSTNEFVTPTNSLTILKKVPDSPTGYRIFNSYPAYNVR
ncbi:RNase A-like domain-containing protein [Actinomadura soli]|uniref:RNase A-like domain-containing protein n=1 Tax=Actinomadura soli TaxID=2508997 RepID=UPI001486EAAB